MAIRIDFNGPRLGLAALRIPLRSQAQAIPSVAWPFGGEKAHRAFSKTPPHPWPGVHRREDTLSVFAKSPAHPFFISNTFGIERVGN